MRCNTCKYWSRYHGSTENGTCHRNPPVVIPEVSGGGFLGIGGFSTEGKTEWPETNRDEFCGEYVANEKP